MIEQDEGQALRVSVALHIGEPDDGGNQRDKEARYGGYNRQYGELELTDEGAFMSEKKFVFPTVQNHQETITHFTLGDPNGGRILIVGEMQPNILISPNVRPELTVWAVGVKLEKLRALGMIGDDGKIITDRPVPAANVGAMREEDFKA